jgi:hypothetical protein
VTHAPPYRWRTPTSERAHKSNGSRGGTRCPATAIALSALLALLVASAAQAGPVVHRHDYLAAAPQATTSFASDVANSNTVAQRAADAAQTVTPFASDVANSNSVAQRAADAAQTVTSFASDVANSNAATRHHHGLASTSATARGATARWTAASSSFGWGAFGIGIGTGVGMMLILASLATAVLAYRRRGGASAPALAP